MLSTINESVAVVAMVIMMMVEVVGCERIGSLPEVEVLWYFFGNHPTARPKGTARQ